ncbi:DUF2470 domain-containing protein [Streptomyces daliensis]|uniref:DUF2470 domain-containing protein n=1 Tax=Streptomyces daliensis TaxID=299421 RepID=A0A8T4IRC8_9ACTN|nr:DUF2470 domain-containing protein [Streptomyces daliensis]
MFRPGIPLPGYDTEGDQPRPTEDARQPTAAERVRTLVESSVSASLTIPGAEAVEQTPQAPLGSGSPEARAVTPDGDVILLVPAASPAARAAAYAQDDDVTAVMEITDVAPVSVPHRIRGRAWVAGWLTAVRNEERAACAQLIAERQPEGPAPDVAWMLLRLEIGEAYVDDLWGAEHVEPDDFASAAPDPLMRHEAELLQHLASSHADQVRGLCSLLGERDAVCGARDEVVPLALDRHGMRVRFCEGGGERCFDARFEFPEPVGDVIQLRRAMHALFEAASDT